MRTECQTSGTSSDFASSELLSGICRHAVHYCQRWAASDGLHTTVWQGVELDTCTANAYCKCTVCNPGSSYRHKSCSSPSLPTSLTPPAQQPSPPPLPLKKPIAPTQQPLLPNTRAPIASHSHSHVRVNKAMTIPENGRNTCGGANLINEHDM